VVLQGAEAGALLICETTVTTLLDGERWWACSDREAGSVTPTVIMAMVGTALARKAGFRTEIAPREVALAVKEIHFMPEETINSRFNIAGNEGVVIEMAGKISQGMVGTGFLYTNNESCSPSVSAACCRTSRSKASRPMHCSKR
jgi:electron transfer flavoprotein-quinone oxidoreductase